LQIPNVEIEPLLAKHASARIPPPIVKYADQNSAKIDDFGKWNLNKSQFHSTASQVKIRIHAIVSESFKPRNYRGAWNGKADRSLLYHFVELFKSLQACGLPTDGVWDYTLFNEDSADATWQHQINTGFGQASSNGANLVILMLKKKKMTSDCYAFFKRMADMEHGVASGCITRRKEDKYIQNYMGNVTMKINLKFPAQETGEPSRNHIVPQILEQLEDTLVIGADVTHPGPGSIAGTPSIAAVIGSADAYGCHYTGSLKLQAHSDEKQSTEVSN
jgi:eukaryotic translation initiation factor 2C